MFSLHARMNWDSKTKGGIVDISQDYDAVEKWTMTAHLKAAVHSNYKDICRKQEIRKEKEMSRKSVINSQERVLKSLRQWKSTKVTLHSVQQEIINYKIFLQEVL